MILAAENTNSSLVNNFLQEGGDPVSIPLLHSWPDATGPWGSVISNQNKEHKGTFSCDVRIKAFTEFNLNTNPVVFETKPSSCDVFLYTLAYCCFSISMLCFTWLDMNHRFVADVWQLYVAGCHSRYNILCMWGKTTLPDTKCKIIE